MNIKMYLQFRHINTEFRIPDDGEVIKWGVVVSM